MNNRNTGIIATAASALLCGCPGLFFCIFGAATASGNMPFSTEVNGVTNSGTLPPAVGFVLLCGSLVLIIIPFVVGFVMLRRKPQMPAGPSEPLPPAS